MKSALNVATISQELSFEDFVRVSAEAGYQGIELIVPTKLEAYIDERGQDAAAQLLDDAGVELAHFFLGLPMQAEGHQFADALGTGAERCRLAVALGMTQVGVWLPPTTDQPASQARADLAARLRDGAQLAGDHGLEMTVEFIGTARGGTPLVRTLADVLEVIDAAGEPNVSALVDLFHFWVGGAAMADLEALPLELLGIIHIDDAPHDGVEGLVDADRVLPGEGVMPVVEMLSICAAKGYEGWASLELFGEELRAMDPAEAAAMGLAATDRVIAQALA